MKAILAASAVLCSVAGMASGSVLIYEPFDYVPGSTLVPGSTATNGGNGLVDTYGPNAPLTWVQAGSYTGGTVIPHQIAGAGLTGPAGFPEGAGNAAILEGGAGVRSDYKEMARMNLPGGPYGAGTTLYYSLLLNVADLTGITTANTNANANNDLIIGFNNASGATSATPNSWAGELTIRRGSTNDTTTFNLGIRASTTAANTTYWSGDLLPNTTYLIVARWTEGDTPGAGGLSELWINPASETFGADLAPAPDGSTVGTFSVTAANDHTNSLIIGAGVATNSNPNQILVDEIRVGTTWADVTSPTSVPEPAVLSLAGLIPLLARRRAV